MSGKRTIKKQTKILRSAILVLGNNFFGKSIQCFFINASPTFALLVSCNWCLNMKFKEYANRI